MNDEIKYIVTAESDLMQVVDGVEVGTLGVRLAPDTADLFASAPELRARVAELEAALAKEQHAHATTAEGTRNMDKAHRATVARVAELEAKIADDSPGTPLGRLGALHAYAEKHLGHSPVSSEPPEAVIFKHITELEATIERVRKAWRTADAEAIDAALDPPKKEKS